MTFNSHENWVRSVIFHPSGKYILSSSDDKSIRVLDIKVISACVFVLSNRLHVTYSNPHLQ